MAKCADEKKFLQNFIQTYECLEALWNVKVEAYCNREEKKKQYEILLEVYKEQYPKGTVDDVKKKINLLRTNFRREKMKLSETSKSGAGADDMDLDDLFYYKELQFLNDVETPCSSKSTINTFKETQPKLEKKKRDPTEALIEIATKRFAPKDNTTTNSIIKGWGAMLDRMVPQQRFLCEKFIAEIIFEGTMGTLDRNSLILNRAPINVRSMNSTPLPTTTSNSDMSLPSGEENSSSLSNFFSSFSHYE